MILDWIKRQRAAFKQAKTMKRAALIEEQEKAIHDFKTAYCADIAFPIVILSMGSYTAVSELREYYYDIDMHRGIEPDSELVDSIGNKYNLNFIETGRWVPYRKKTGTMDSGELKKKASSVALYAATQEGNRFEKGHSRDY